jgi:hypothetical protein
MPRNRFCPKFWEVSLRKVLKLMNQVLALADPEGISLRSGWLLSPTG